VNGIDTTKYIYAVKQDAVKDHGDKVKVDDHVKKGQSSYYDWMK